MQIGAKIYWDKLTGNVILNTGERSGDVIETTREQDFATYVVLSERVPESVGLIQLEYGQHRDKFAQYTYRIDPSTEAILWGEQIGQSLEEKKSAKILQLKIAETEALKTFQSSALGTPHTYVRVSDTGENFSEFFNGKFSYINSVLYNGNPIKWYTVEAGNVDHTKDQFNTVYTDGLNHVEITKLHRATLEAQVNAATTVDALDAITW